MPVNPYQAPRARVAIIGAGFAGIAMAHELQRAGFHDYEILERADSPGGTWRDNKYPGAACDVPTLLYSFSFFDNPSWPDFFGTQKDIHQYIHEASRQLGIEQHIRYNTTVLSACYAEDNAQWTVTTESGDERVYEHVIFAVGQLSEPKIPAIPGLDGFRGRQLHSARWAEDIDLTGKRVAIIGNGATVIQLAPAVADRVQSLSVFQRSANWIIPKPLRPQSRLFDLLERSKTGRKLLRAWLYVQRERRISVMTDEKANQKLTDVSLGFFNRSIADPEVRSQLVPDYKLGCKRVLISNHYLQMFGEEHVSLVTHGVQRVEEDTIITADGARHEADVIIFCTGFKATEFLSSVEVTGRGGVSLEEAWSDGASAYLGTSVPGFPNMFTMLGPNTGLGFNSMIYMIESQARHIVRLLKQKQRKQYSEIEVRQSAHDRFNTWLQPKLEHTAWAGTCNSWYKTDDGKITVNWPLPTYTYRAMTRFLPLRDYRFSSVRRTTNPQPVQREYAHAS
ncbi:flavin-containing monooxygenase [Arthrobacter sulfonylureivorans]|uniref:NAD(P)/FAD-dependent oxidoreductase n=1 Tax=Arthrobacter sulfonylureivorans TaxID=2486855 RepID=A0ABY3WCP8_9MICC|nr:NAD(P)/FAD-dependent oxidoreductase [Arthrobacter sulfonylureivorans]UNK47781.1 NAD(P)/FAD-dependent oxidoreductase [Arthrobacter sulfonylureivorans]